MNPPRPVQFEDLDDDILIYITSFALHPSLTQVKLFNLSRRPRNVFKPARFYHIQWAPRDTDFPPQDLFPYIHALSLAPDMYTTYKAFDHADIVDQLRQNLPFLPNLETFFLSPLIEGGLWTELVEALAAAPKLINLCIHSPCGPASEACHLSLPHPKRNRLGRSRLLSSCHTTLEHVELPGKLFFGSFDVTVDSTALRNLEVTGFWPDVIHPDATRMSRKMSLKVVRSPKINSTEDLATEELMLASIAQKHSLLERVTVNRLWNHEDEVLENLWDPIPRFRLFLSNLHHLKVFDFNLDDPERYLEFRFTERGGPGFWDYVERLEKLALDVIGLCPSPKIQEVAMFHDLSGDPWERWAVLRFRDGTPKLDSIFM
ncbi:hypothetical protein MIND_00022800 [Mycena indigotica]|uniref:F-box domain-containing protein n=1 Tax=Mycena indigotica TaxID=2126181 RepID=A0A8H6TE60_9AGAR|nr:uncharacterized protein MIND_00022800 [Mycena indigotica]KAF7315086.1 hypothetical protein MIND_00022800 [Mycena indigotica]